MKYFPILIFVLAFAIKVWGASSLFFWNVDEDIVALTVKRILVDHRPQLLGFPIPGGIYPGPLIFYVISVPYFLFRMNPIGLPIFSALFGALTTYLIYKIGSETFEDKMVGIFASIIYGFSFLANIYSRVFTGLTFAPLLILLTYLILFRILRNKNKEGFLWLCLILAASVQNEGSSFSLVLLAFVSWLVFKIKISKFNLVQILTVFFIFHIPLLIFELRHNFFLLRNLLNFFNGHNANSPVSISINKIIDSLLVFPKVFSRFLMTSGEKDISGQILQNCVDAAVKTSPLLYIGTFFLILYFLYKTFRGKDFPVGGKIASLHLLILVFGLVVYNFFLGGYLFEWVLVIFFPGFALITAYFLSIVYKQISKIIVYVLLVIFILINIQSVLQATASYNLEARRSVVKETLAKIGGSPFFFESIGSCYAQGYLYLFWYYGNLPVYVENIKIDPLLIGQKGDSVRPNFGVVFVNPSKKESSAFFIKYFKYKKQAKQEFKIGDTEVLLVEEKQRLE